MSLTGAGDRPADSGAWQEGTGHPVSALFKRGAHSLRLASAEHRSTAATIVYSVTAVYALLFVASAVVSYNAYDLWRLDLGNMVQAVWSTAHGHFLESTTFDGVQASRLGAHVDPFLLLMVPLWWVWSSPLMLLVVQIVAVASGALPVFWLARKHLASSRAAAHFAVVYLLYPGTQFNVLSETGFHPVSFAVPLILFAIWFLDEDRLLPFALCALLAASTKEEIPAAVGCLGLWYAQRHGRRWRAGLSIFALGLIASAVNFLIIIPHFSVSGETPYVGRYRNVGGSPGGMVDKLFGDPLAFVHAVATTHKAFYLAALIVPLLGLSLREPLLLLGAAPDLVINLLSAANGQTVITTHYVAGILPFLFAAAIFGAAKIRRRAEGLSLVMVALVGSVAFLSPLWLGVKDFREALPGNALHAAKARALQLVPPGVPVSASNEFGALLSARRFSYMAPQIRGAHWVVADLNDPTYADSASYRRSIQRLGHDPHWRLVYDSQGIEVLQRRN
jgi:uncharacterized membrane protein